MKILSDKFYRPDSPELRPLAAVQTFAAWRHQNKGPAFTKGGSRVLYKGSDILEWLDTQRVETAA